MDFASSTRTADEVERDCREVICGAPTTFQGYGTDRYVILLSTFKEMEYI